MDTSMKLSSEDFPVCYIAADKASTQKQSRFVKLTLLNIALMIVAAILGSIIISNTTGKIILAIVSSILLTIGICFTFFIRATKLEQDWYDGRAIAESIKTVTWRYITGCDPYSLKLGSVADEQFLKDLKTILDERKKFAANLCNQHDMSQLISEKMRTIRGLDVESRKKIYLIERINDQRNWYNKKTQINLKSSSRFFYGTFISQTLAIITAISMIFWQNSPIQFTGIFTTTATGFIAWTQMRKNEELAQSYALAAQELTFIYEQSRQVITEEQLSTYVANAEIAISREHTMWVARRCE